MKIGEYEYEVLSKAQSITLTNYLENVKWFDAENIDGYLDTGDLFTVIEDLIYEVHNLEEKLENLENKDNEDSDLYDKWEDNQLEEGLL